MTTGEYEVDSHAPVFFLSYSQVSTHFLGPVREPNQYVMELFSDLSAHVGELVGRRPGEDPGFLDRTLSGGQRWTDELFRAAGTCQVFVPLISASLLTSEWCAMEWDAFSRRRIVRRKDGRRDLETGIVPVIWTPTALGDLPPVVREIQLFSPTRLPDPSFAAQYQQEGLYGLRELGLNVAYKAIVWRLAQRIVAIHRSHRVAPQIPTSTESLHNVFAKQEEEA